MFTGAFTKIIMALFELTDMVGFFYCHQYCTEPAEKGEKLYFLDVKKFASGIVQQKEISDLRFAGLPASIDKSEFEKFYRVMCAKEAAEIKDISTEEVIAMFKNISVFGQYFFDREMPYGNISKQLFEEKSQITRRVL